jgi:murein DD-endopeptidase MepM/ murein hydrolase activator NlpD
VVSAVKGFRAAALLLAAPLLCSAAYILLYAAAVWLAIPQLPESARDPLAAWAAGENADAAEGPLQAVPAGAGVGWSGYAAAAELPAGLPLSGSVYLGCLFNDPAYTGHSGVDFPAATGSPLAATLAGEVVWAGENGPWGNLVVVENAGLQTWFAHLSAIHVSAGQQVAAGDALGEVGSSGNSTGPHLHYAILQQTAGGQVWLDPLPYFAGAAYIKIACAD